MYIQYSAPITTFYWVIYVSGSKFALIWVGGQTRELCIDLLVFHLDFIYRLFFHCLRHLDMRAHWRNSCLIEKDLFRASLLPCLIFIFFICIDSETTLLSVTAHFKWESALSSMGIAGACWAAPLASDWLQLIVKSHWHEWWLIRLRTESAID